MDELKKMASPKFNELAVIIGEQTNILKEQSDLLDAQVVLLDRLCTLKESQQETDAEHHGKWNRAKIFDTRISLIVLIIATAGIYMDVIKINSDSPVINSIINLFN